MSDADHAPAKPTGLLSNKNMRLALAIGGALIAVVAIAGLLKPDKPITYRTEAIRRTTVSRSVSASGSLDAVDSVTVGSQLSGQIKQVLVDFNAPVKQGQLLAVIDTETYDARIRQAEASVEQAAADMRVAQADFDRQKRLADADLVAKKTLEDATATLDRARAEMKTAKATLSSAQNDLSHAKITSPIDGMVVDRQIDPGQTVAASLNAPVLFVIAKDLSKMQIKIAVDEADIGQVREGQAVRFTVDAFPDETFDGQVSQVRKEPVKTANVVTYTVIALADNPERKLLPGMTANADIIIEEHPNVLAAPTTALRWKPAGAQASTNASTSSAGAASSGGFAGGGFGAPAGGGGGFGGRQQVPIAQNPLFKDLALDDKQKAAITSITDAQRAKVRDLFMQSGGDRDKMRAQISKMRQDTNDQIAAILRPDQKTKFQAKVAELLAAAGGAGGRANAEKLQQRTIYLLANNKPKATQVMVGANDGTLMEVRGDIKEGDLVITGGGPQSASPQGQQGPGGRGGRSGFGPFGAP